LSIDRAIAKVVNPARSAGDRFAGVVSRQDGKVSRCQAAQDRRLDGLSRRANRL